MDKKKNLIEMNDSYPSVRGAAVKRSDIQYLKGWDRLDEYTEAKRVFDILFQAGRVHSWGWSSFKHVKKEPGLRRELQDARKRFRENDYEFTKINKRYKVTDVGESQATTIMASLQSQLTRISGSFTAVSAISPYDANPMAKSDALDQFYHTLAKSLDEMKVTLSKERVSASLQASRLAKANHEEDDDGKGPKTKKQDKKRKRQ